MENGDGCIFFIELFKKLDHFSTDGALSYYSLIIIIIIISLLDTRRRDWGLRKRADEDLHLRLFFLFC